MGRVQHQLDTFIANELRQTFRAAIATDAHLARKVGGNAANTRQAVDMFGPQCAGDGQGFRHAAQQQDAFHSGLITSSRVIGSAWRQVSKPPSGWAWAT